MGHSPAPAGSDGRAIAINEEASGGIQPAGGRAGRWTLTRPRDGERCMAEMKVLHLSELPRGQKKTVKLAETEILLIHHEGGLAAVQAKCPHAGAPLEQGAVCEGRLTCPWHMGVFAIPGGTLLEPPAMQPLMTYPVRVEGDDVFVDSEPVAAPSLKRGEPNSRVFLLIGTGAAGAMAAATLRQEGFGGRIVAVDPRSEEPIDRTQLSKQALSGKLPVKKLGMGTFDKVPVERWTTGLEALSSAEGVATFSDGRTLHFDRALVATGGRPKRLEIPGSEHAYTIRHAADVQEILKQAEGKPRAVILGTSFIALEAASALIQKGTQVTVVGREKSPFAARFGDEIAHSLVSLHKANGTVFKLECEVLRIEPGRVILRKDGQEEDIEADVILQGVGVSPDLGFKHDLPLAPEGGGIVADETLHAAGGVWVAGDIASVNGTRIEHWRLAQQHGQVAARSMLGKDARYEGVPFFWTFHFGKRLGYLGHAAEWDEIVLDGDAAALSFVAFFVKEGRVEAVCSCGRDHDTAKLAETLKGMPSLEQARAAIR